MGVLLGKLFLLRIDLLFFGFFALGDDPEPLDLGVGEGADLDGQSGNVPGSGLELAHALDLRREDDFKVGL